MSNKLYIVQLQRQDRSAFKTLVQENQDLVFNTLLSFVSDNHDAEDLSQEVFVKAYHALSSFKGESKISTWLYRLSVNTALEYLRAQGRLKRKSFLVSLFGKNEVLEIPDFMHPGVQIENQERAAILNKAIEKLPEKQMIAYRLRNYEDLSYDDISDIMSTTKSSVESLLHRAKQNLRTELKEYYTQNMID